MSLRNNLPLAHFPAGLKAGGHSFVSEGKNYAPAPEV